MADQLSKARGVKGFDNGEVEGVMIELSPAGNYQIKHSIRIQIILSNQILYDFQRTISGTHNSENQ